MNYETVHRIKFTVLANPSWSKYLPSSSSYIQIKAMQLNFDPVVSSLSYNCNSFLFCLLFLNTLYTHTNTHDIACTRQIIWGGCKGEGEKERWQRGVLTITAFQFVYVCLWICTCIWYDKSGFKLKSAAIFCAQRACLNFSLYLTRKKTWSIFDFSASKFVKQTRCFYLILSRFCVFEKNDMRTWRKGFGQK